MITVTYSRDGQTPKASEHSVDRDVELRERAAVRRVYESIAPQYDRRVGANSEVDAFFMEGESRFVLSRVAPADRVLDIGCGTGRYTARMLAAGVRAVGLDMSAAMIRQARSKSAAAPHGGSWVQAEMGNLPFADGSFDVVTCVLAIMHLARSERQRVFTEVSRVLRPRGRFVLTCKNGLVEKLSGKDRFASLDFTDVKRQRMIFTNLDGYDDMEAQWNSFSRTELRRLCRRSGLRMTTLHGHFALASWLPHSHLRRRSVRRAVAAVERTLTGVWPLSLAGYHLLVEAVKPERRP